MAGWNLWDVGSVAGGPCGCCGGTHAPCSCMPCDIPAANLTLTIVGDPACAIACVMPSQVITLTFSGVCSSGSWTGTLTGTFSGSPQTIYVQVICISGLFQLSLSFSPTYSPTICTAGGVLTLTNASSFTCSPFMAQWTGPTLDAFGPYVCGCCIESLTITA